MSGLGLRSTYAVATPPKEVFHYDYRNLNRSEVFDAYIKNQPIVGIVTDIDIPSRKFLVKLGESITAVLPFQEAIIQKEVPLTYPNYTGEMSISNYSESLLNQRIPVNVLEINFDRIVVTRIPILTEAYNSFLELPLFAEMPVLCTVLSVSKKFVFVDCGNGLLGSILVNDLSVIRYTKLENWVSVGDQFYAILKDINKENMRISLSRKDYYLNYNQDIKNIYKNGEINMKVVQIAQRTPRKDGYFVELNPGIAGIMDTKRYHEEGDLTIAIVTKITADDTKPCGYKIHLDEY